MPIFYVLLMFIVPIAAGLLLGLAQLGVYRVVGRPAQATPPFVILFARGLLGFFLVAAILALATRAGG